MHSQVGVNQPGFDPQTMQAITKNDLSVGKYAVTVDAGPSYQTQRQEARDSMMQFMQAFEPAAAVMGDLVAKNMDWPGAEEISERLKLLLPPPVAQMIAQKAQAGGKPDPAAMMQQVAQTHQQLQQAQQMMQQLQQENQQLKAGVQEKVQVATITAQQHMHDTQITAQQHITDAQEETKRRQQDSFFRSKADIEEAQVKAVTAIKVAEIQAQTQLAIAALTPAPQGIVDANPTGGSVQ